MQQLEQQQQRRSRAQQMPSMNESGTLCYYSTVPLCFLLHLAWPTIAVNMTASVVQSDNTW